MIMFEQSRMAITLRNLELFDKKRALNHFWQSVDAILEDVSVAKTVV